MIVSASRLETGRTVSFSGRESGSIGTVSVTTMPLDPVVVGEPLEDVVAEDAVRREQPHLVDAVLLERADVREHRAAGHDHVVADDRALAANTTCDLGHRGDVVGGARLVHDRELGLDHLGEALGLLGATRVG